MKILGIDPGTARAGWAIVEKIKGNAHLISFGCITTSVKNPVEERLLDVFNQLQKILKTHKPTTVAVEDLFFTTNAKTVIQVSQARGVILLACAQIGIPVVSYSPLAVKLAVAGYGRAEKKQVQKMVAGILKLPKIPQPDDAADAVAIALTHCFSSHV